MRPYEGPPVEKDPELDAAIHALREFEKQDARAREAPVSEVSAYIAPVALPMSHERTQEVDRVKIAAAVAPAPAPKVRMPQLPTVTVAQRADIGRRRSRAVLYAIGGAIVVVLLLFFAILSLTGHRTESAGAAPSAPAPTFAPISTMTAGPISTPTATTPVRAAEPTDSSAKATEPAPSHSPRARPSPNPSATPRALPPEILP